MAGGLQNRVFVHAVRAVSGSDRRRVRAAGIEPAKGTEAGLARLPAMSLGAASRPMARTRSLLEPVDSEGSSVRPELRCGLEARLVMAVSFPGRVKAHRRGGAGAMMVAAQVGATDRTKTWE